MSASDLASEEEAGEGGVVVMVVVSMLRKKNTQIFNHLFRRKQKHRKSFTLGLQRVITCKGC